MISRRKLALLGMLAVAGLGAITPSSEGVYFCAPCSDPGATESTALGILWNKPEPLCLSDISEPAKKPEIRDDAVDL